MSCTPATHSVRGEIRFRPIAAGLPLARVIDEELRDLAERAPFLAVVDDHADAACLRLLHAHLDAVREIRAAGADVGAEHVRAVAFVVHAAGDPWFRRGRAGTRRRTDRPSRRRSAAGTRRDPAGSRARGTCPRSARTGSGAASPSATPNRSATPGQPPDRLDRDLGDPRRAVRSEHHVRPGGSGASRPSCIASTISGMAICARVTAMVGRMSQPAATRSANTCGATWPHGSSETMRPGCAPGGERADCVGRHRVRQIRPMSGRELAGGDRQRTVERIGPAMRADDVALIGVAQRPDDRPAPDGIGSAPIDRRSRLGAMGREGDVPGRSAVHGGMLGSRSLKGQLH